MRGRPFHREISREMRVGMAGAFSLPYLTKPFPAVSGSAAANASAVAGWIRTGGRSEISTTSVVVPKRELSSSVTFKNGVLDLGNGLVPILIATDLQARELFEHFLEGELHFASDRSETIERRKISGTCW